jgi:hypothetical protein
LELSRARFCEKAFEIFDKFINPQTAGDKEINLPAWIRNELLEIFSTQPQNNRNNNFQSTEITTIVERNYDNSKITKNTFDKAQKHILELLRYDIWPRFLQSEYFVR